MQSWIYCALNRHYVVPELAVILQDSAEAMEQSHAGTVTLILDAGFPFFDGFPLLPHLSHHDGRKVDLAFYYADTNGDYLPGATRSPIGYFAFEQGPGQCPESWPTLRWDLDWAQPLWTTYTPDVPRMKALLGIFAGDSRIGKILLEPHLVASWGVAHPKIRFQGCRAARHDDHVHVQM